MITVNTMIERLQLIARCGGGDYLLAAQTPDGEPFLLPSGVGTADPPHSIVTIGEWPLLTTDQLKALRGST